MKATTPSGSSGVLTGNAGFAGLVIGTIIALGTTGLHSPCYSMQVCN
jgi:hypothetical protein